ncbi:tRNA (adenosine(37)-N6)-threonylcarbamoyltransferase complex ATPase subunit type 1 TsaE [Candidatus Gottesmanbacteria bacterium RIFCSPLOWO2_01_FULL_39_12b]|uniref:tRNA threonylcarbamoyladenosine biosynthesis protein TsaE n=1 Tax=Candidatus Gottesmanbacteria bacterium RIFCSPLOWO2_01_FULL_39_12b TaxID=1798388 RepID=A0A1F6AQ58_9BACT|nr:MAG: tRNA (adenosine(37)-N6)-threonylcarbamoyltransferase complex ATPase subunit type 1 TsaE [Candidatus Gottesmanbacteria bacterium RIFCSPLOWO2_01_FULL_39_12b]
MDYLTLSPLETKEIGKRTGKLLSGGEVLCLYGELGVGKSVFVKGLIEYFLPNARVLSPTFIIVRHYGVNQHKKIKKIYHADLYRIENKSEIQSLELFENFYKSDSIVLIEWAEKLENMLPERRIDIKISILGENKRKIEVSSV